ncbi:hypothetical protein HY772_02580 [Candidatus Woesearchaeota archaeon]|nr:hypothetical protein [Candidatus Woesearchaeota archaeon]
MMALPEKIIKPAVRRDILRVLKRAQRLIVNHKHRQLMELSDHTVHNASLFQDRDSVSVAVIIYSIAKLMERCGKPFPYCNDINVIVAAAERTLRSDQVPEFRDRIKALFKFIGDVDKSFKMYIDAVMDKAQIKKGSMLHERGISVARAATVLGIGQWELLSYIGKTQLHDRQAQPSNVETRLSFARTLFSNHK